MQGVWLPHTACPQWLWGNFDSCFCDPFTFPSIRSEKPVSHREHCHILLSAGYGPMGSEMLWPSRIIGKGNSLGSSYPTENPCISIQVLFQMNLHCFKLTDEQDNAFRAHFLLSPSTACQFSLMTLIYNDSYFLHVSCTFPIPFCSTCCSFLLQNWLRAVNGNQDTARMLSTVLTFPLPNNSYIIF